MSSPSYARRPILLPGRVGLEGYERRSPRLVAARRVAAVAVFGCAPVLLLVGFTLFAPRETFAWDFHAFWGAAANVIHGRNPYTGFGSTSSGTPYPLYLYPPLLAEAIAPLGALPFSVAAPLFVIASVGALGFALWLIGVRDWRCYGAAFLWLPVLHGLTLGTLTPFLVLGLAACWRLRDTKAMEPVLAVVVTLKLFLWPVLIVTIARRGFGSARRSLAWTAAGAVGSWAVIGFAGLTTYPSLLSATQGEWVSNGYGVGALLSRLGFSHGTVTMALLCCAAVGLAVLSRIQDARVQFGGAIVVACIVSPVVWLHYAALLLAVVAIFQPTFGWAWIVPLLLWLSPNEEAHGALGRIALWSLVLILTFALAMRPTLGSASSRRRLGSVAPGARAPV